MLRSRFQSIHRRREAALRLWTFSNSQKGGKKRTLMSVTAAKKRILIKRVHEFGSITIIAHQQTASGSMIVKSLFILIASFDCFSLLIVGGGLWPPARSHCRLSWQAALVHRKLRPDFSVKDAESKEMEKQNHLLVVSIIIPN